MKTTIDKAGRIVIPASIRERLGILPGPVDLIVDGTGVRIEAEARGTVVDEDGILVIDSTDTALDADAIRELRLADQR